MEKLFTLKTFFEKWLMGGCILGVFFKKNNLKAKVPVDELIIA